MTTAQLAKRLGVSQPRVVGIEQAEAKGAITLNSLERAAHALPRKPLDALVEERAARLADKRLASTRHTMALEAQAMDTGDEDEQRKRLIRKLIEQAGSELWDDAWRSAVGRGRLQASLLDLTKLDGKSNHTGNRRC